MRGVLAFLTVVLAGCFEPRLPAVSCDEGVCPDGLVCNTQNQCVPRGQQSIDASSTDAAIDASSSDAGPLGLVDAGLLGRWFIDEAASGTAIAALTDSVPGGLDLDINYNDTQWIEKEGHRGLEIGPGVGGGGGGGAIQSLAGSALAEGLDGSEQFTLEMVVEFNINSLPMLLNISGNGSGRLELIITGQLDARLIPGQGEGRWNINLPTRSVLHVVFDSGSQDPALLYIDGVPVDATTSNFTANSTLDLGGAPAIGIGNAPTTGRPLDGILYYAAIYNRALPQAGVAANAAILADVDDRP